MSSVHTTPEKSENATTTGHFGFVVEENSFKEITRLSQWQKSPFSKMYSVHIKTQSRRLQIPLVLKSVLVGGISVDGWLIHGKKLRFQIKFLRRTEDEALNN